MPGALNGRVPNQIHEQDNEQITTSKIITKTNDDWSDVTKELVDSLPQVWTRGLLYFLVIFISIILPWAMLFKVDETGTARGRFEPKGKTIRLDSFVSGSVEAISVKEGDTVKKGQSLLVLDSELVKAELRQIQDRLEGQLNRLSQLKSSQNQLVVSLTTQQQQNQAQQLEKQAQIDQVRQNIIALRNTYNLQKEEKLAQVNQARQTIEHNQTASKLIESSLTSAKREAQRYQQLFQKGVIPEIQLIEKQDNVKERQRLYEQSKSDIQQARLRLAEQQSSYQRIVKQGNADIEQAELQLKEQ
ncbi:MAG: biotin/lipoyl-binding protein, partial [Cyanobacteriota bacterium]|nr:biotin/lipoyl-binding protein [Cyanobacteriota bacterium]